MIKKLFHWLYFCPQVFWGQILSSMFNRGQDFGLNIKFLTLDLLLFMFLCSILGEHWYRHTGRGNILLVVSIVDLIHRGLQVHDYMPQLFQLFKDTHPHFYMWVITNPLWWTYWALQKNVMVLSMGHLATWIISTNPLIQYE
jgi:hypothetical protein